MRKEGREQLIIQYKFFVFSELVLIGVILGLFLAVALCGFLLLLITTCASSS